MKKSKGFTLIELLLYTAAVSVLTIILFNIYNQYRVNQNVINVSKELQLIDSAIQNQYSALEDYAGLTNTTAISNRLIPDRLVMNSNTISNGFGGPLVITSELIGTDNGYRIELRNITSDVCSKLSTSNFSYSVTQLFLNGSAVNNIGTRLTSADIPTITVRCNSSNNNTIAYKNKILKKDLVPTVSTNPVRNKEDANYIATIGDVSAGVLTCNGGSVSNGSFCACPLGTEWNGTQCLAFGNTTVQAGWCPRGQGWTPGTKVCANLPNTSYTGFVGNTYTEGRNIPGNITTPVVQTNIGGRVAPAAKTAADPEYISGRRITWEAGYVDDKTVQVCVNGTWDNVKLRCVTPIN